MLILIGINLIDLAGWKTDAIELFHLDINWGPRGDIEFVTLYVPGPGAFMLEVFTSF
jgi:hypothetical protein